MTVFLKKTKIKKTISRMDSLKGVWLQLESRERANPPNTYKYYSVLGSIKSSVME